MLIPGLVAVVLTRWVFREPLRASLGLFFSPNRWWLVAWLAPPLLMLATLGVSLLWPGTSFDPTMSGLGARMGFSPHDAEALRAQAGFLGLPPLAGFLAQGLLLGPTLLALGGLGEELAWRGWLHHELAPLGFGAAPSSRRRSGASGTSRSRCRGTATHTIPSWARSCSSRTSSSFRRCSRSCGCAPAPSSPRILHGTADGTVLLTLALVRGGGELTTGWGSLACVGVLGPSVNLAPGGRGPAPSLRRRRDCCNGERA